MKKNFIVGTFFFLLLLNIPLIFAAETPQDFVHLGNVDGRLGKYKEAIGEYTKALHADPGFISAYYNRGYVYVEMRKYKLAIADLDKTIELNSKYAPAYHIRGIAYFLRKKYPQAIADYGHAIELDPDNVRFHFSLLSAYCKMGNNDRAWKEVIKIQGLGGTVNPLIINLLKNKKYRDQ